MLRSPACVCSEKKLILLLLQGTWDLLHQFPCLSPCVDAGNLGFPSKGENHWGPAPPLLLKRNLSGFLLFPVLLEQSWEFFRLCSFLVCYRKSGICKDESQSWGHLQAPPLFWGEASKHNSWVALKDQTCHFQL